MALVTRAEARNKGVSGTPCSIGKVYETVADKPDELAELNAILYEEGNSQAVVFSILTTNGDFEFTIGLQTVNKHRGKSCRCFREAPFRFCFECRRDNPSCVCGDAA